MVKNTAIVLNLDSGTLKGLQSEEAKALILPHLQGELSGAKLFTISGRDITERLKHIFSDSGYDRIIVCGGDGTVSFAAGLAFEHDKVLGVLPGGTMNLFARTLGMPLDLEEACENLTKAKTVRCDLASCNGHSYVHQFSLGLQPEVIAERKTLSYNSRLSKIWASARTLLRIVMRQADYRIVAAVDSDKARELEVCLLTIANNPYGPGHLPYADRLDGGRLAMYWSKQLTPWRKSRLISDVLTGRWDANQDLETLEAESIALHLPRTPKNASASIDGELVPLKRRLEFKILKGALRVLVPSDSHVCSKSCVQS